MSNNEIEKDKKLVENAIDGDQQSFAKIYSRYSTYIYNRVFYRKMDSEFAKDVVQETFSTFYKKMRAFDTTKFLGNFLSGIADNQILSYGRKNPTMDNLESAGEKIINPSQENEMIDKENKKLVFEKMSMLDEEIRIILLMHVKEGKSFKEISEILNIPIGTVKSRISRGTDKLEKLLEGLI